LPIEGTSETLLQRLRSYASEEAEKAHQIVMERAGRVEEGSDDGTSA
jgi:hypothetical protein